MFSLLSFSTRINILLRSRKTSDRALVSLVRPPAVFLDLKLSFRLDCRPSLESGLCSSARAPFLRATGSLLPRSGSIREQWLVIESTLHYFLRPHGTPSSTW